ncbi:hypothetical protein A1O3_00857 [Capronia epimyces CBS 606.96]|uniref:Uncharacterized protein n=1 Tax=Capronia epimyces CBS 606.96 TaxID=1182542 RepID=W9YHD4_9EURO|nr:uncharacterized protein A1O3_00857 [Capronia epimyces CBS 606.96]EXJ92307.1 hypothetical protein A1O3_00857 [Capronia epimyces CBS 606.96]
MQQTLESLNHGFLSTPSAPSSSSSLSLPLPHYWSRTHSTLERRRRSSTKPARRIVTASAKAISLDVTPMPLAISASVAVSWD